MVEESSGAVEAGPFNDLDEVLSSIAHALVAKGRLEDAQILARSDVSFERTGWDNWDGGTEVWTLEIKIPYPSYTAYSDEERQEFIEFVDKVIQPFVPESGYWASAKLSPMPFKDPEWRRNVLEAVSGRITNQGRAHSDNVAPIEFDGLRFRSEPERLLYIALKATGIPFAPLPVLIRGGGRFSRTEPDFVLIKDGLVLFVEIDGASYHRESPADAHYRLKPFQDEGVIVERVKASHCNTPALAQRYANHLVDRNRSAYWK